MTNKFAPRKFLSLLTVAMMATSSLAQAGDEVDKTGTNPVNFQREIRLYNEYTWLNTAGDGNQNLTTLEYRTPFLDGKWQWRLRAKYNSLNADLNNDGIDDVDESGLGDWDMRFLITRRLGRKSSLNSGNTCCWRSFCVIFA